MCVHYDHALNGTQAVSFLFQRSLLMYISRVGLSSMSVIVGNWALLLLSLQTRACSTYNRRLFSRICVGYCQYWAKVLSLSFYFVTKTYEVFIWGGFLFEHPKLIFEYFDLFQKYPYTTIPKLCLLEINFSFFQKFTFKKWKKNGSGMSTFRSKMFLFRKVRWRLRCHP